MYFSILHPLFMTFTLPHHVQHPVLPLTPPVPSNPLEAPKSDDESDDDAPTSATRRLRHVGRGYPLEEDTPSLLQYVGGKWTLPVVSLFCGRPPAPSRYLQVLF